MEAHLAMVSQAVPPTPPPQKRVQEERLVVAEGTNPTQLPSHSLRQPETGYMYSKMEIISVGTTVLFEVYPPPPVKSQKWTFMDFVQMSQ